MTQRTPLAKALGLGAAKTGIGDWSRQRLTAIALIPLTFWMVAFIKRLGTFDHAQISAWISEPINSLFAVSLVIIAFYHAILGLQVVIEDYVHSLSCKITLLWGIKISFSLLALSALLSLLRIILS
jgi:succinate dehydrogenase / fumarate reductase membrane anchor subunit